jgi:hypothetical protein
MASLVAVVVPITPVEAARFALDGNLLKEVPAGRGVELWTNQVVRLQPENTPSPIRARVLVKTREGERVTYTFVSLV